MPRRSPADYLRHGPAGVPVALGAARRLFIIPMSLFAMQAGGRLRCRSQRSAEEEADDDAEEAAAAEAVVSLDAEQPPPPPPQPEEYMDVAELARRFAATVTQLLAVEAGITRDSPAHRRLLLGLLPRVLAVGTRPLGCSLAELQQIVAPALSALCRQAAEQRLLPAGQQGPESEAQEAAQVVRAWVHGSPPELPAIERIGVLRIAFDAAVVDDGRRRQAAELALAAAASGTAPGVLLDYLRHLSRWPADEHFATLSGLWAQWQRFPQTPLQRQRHALVLSYSPEAVAERRARLQAAQAAQGEAHLQMQQAAGPQMQAEWPQQQAPDAGLHRM